MTKCDACKIEFEPKTRMIETKDNGGVYHVGCWARINKAMLIYDQNTGHWEYGVD